MNIEELREYLEDAPYIRDENEIWIKVDEPSVAMTPAIKVWDVYQGIDWDDGRLLVNPEFELVSWQYLETVHPGIKREIAEDRKRYLHRPLRVGIVIGYEFGGDPAGCAFIEEQLKRLPCSPYITADRIEVVFTKEHSKPDQIVKFCKEQGYSIVELERNKHLDKSKLLVDYVGEKRNEYRTKVMAFSDGEDKDVFWVMKEAVNCDISLEIYEPTHDPKHPYAKREPFEYEYSYD